MSKAHIAGCDSNANGSQFMLGENHNTLRIVVMSILSLEVPVA
jgi:hypothetical protein